MLRRVRVLVTGGAGFIGSHLVDALVACGDEVVVLDNLATGRAENVPGGVAFVEGSVADEAVVAEAVDGCGVVYHQGALGSVARSVADPLASDGANVAGTLTVLRAAQRAGVARVPTPESVPLRPRSPYAVTKLAAEHYARVFWELHGLETVSLRYFNVYGPRQRPDSEYAAVIPRFVEALLRGADPHVHGDGRQTRDFTFVADAVQANLLAAVAPAAACAGRAFNVARGEPASLLDLLDILAAELGVTPRPTHGPPRAGDVRHTHADISAARAALGYEPAVSLRDGLVGTLAWFREARVSG
jgi:UDP-N-acetylglucosamine/UDP-N-acetyl-alpha-D-glucosaminouronate 4-epimerase